MGEPVDTAPGVSMDTGTSLRTTFPAVPGVMKSVDFRETASRELPCDAVPGNGPSSTVKLEDLVHVLHVSGSWIREIDGLVVTYEYKG
jgi:hypothetical protein